MEKLSQLLGSKYSHFLSLNSIEKTSFVLGSELWEENFYSLLTLVKRYIVDIWEFRKNESDLYSSLSVSWESGESGE